MIVGALMCPPGIVGMIEASTTRNPVDAAHAQFVVDHRHAVMTHLAGAAGMLRRRAEWRR